MEFNEAEITEAFPSATVVLVRDGDAGLEVLMVCRSEQVKHMGGMWVFPGGRVDPEDQVESGDVHAAAVNAAIRETEEEAGLIIAADHLYYISHWTTPEGAKKRFATWFLSVYWSRIKKLLLTGARYPTTAGYCPPRR